MTIFAYLHNFEVSKNYYMSFQFSIRNQHCKFFEQCSKNYKVCINPIIILRINKNKKKIVLLACSVYTFVEINQYFFNDHHTKYALLDTLFSYPHTFFPHLCAFIHSCIHTLTLHHIHIQNFLINTACITNYFNQMIVRESNVETSKIRIHLRQVAHQ